VTGGRPGGGRPGGGRPGGGRLRPVQAALQGVADQLDPVVQLQLPERVLDVVLHGPVRKHQPISDLSVGQPGGHQPQHLGLPVGQPRPVVVRPGRAGRHPTELTEHQAGQTRGEDRVAVRRPTDGVDQLGPGGRLDQVAGRSGLDRLQDVALLAAGRQHQHPYLRARLDDPAGGLDAVQSGHLQIGHHDGGSGGHRPIDRLEPVGGRGDHLEAGLAQIAGDRVPPHRVVVGHQHPERLNPRRLIRHPTALTRPPYGGSVGRPRYLPPARCGCRWYRPARPPAPARSGPPPAGRPASPRPAWTG
jgi:hypothetical protein